MPSGMRASRTAQEGGLVDLFFLVAVIGFVAALSLSAGVFLYHQYLASNAASKQEQIKQARSAFEPALIQELLRLDSRLTAANAILAKHLAPSELFRLIGELTLQSISYSSLEYATHEDGTLTLTMQGVAQSVNGVALQADVFAKHNAIVNPIFSDLNFVDEGVSFTVNTEINPAALRYVSLVNTVSMPAAQTFDQNTTGSSFGDTAAGADAPGGNTSTQNETFDTQQNSFGDFSPSAGTTNP